MSRPAPYEPVMARRMWGVFRVLADGVLDGGDGHGGKAFAMFPTEHAANSWLGWQMRLIRRNPMRIAVGNMDEYDVLAVDDVTGWVWNDIDPPGVTP